MQCSSCLSSRIAGSKRPTIREGDLPLSKVLKTSRFVASLQKVAKESDNLKVFTLEGKVVWTVPSQLCRSQNHYLCIEHLSQALGKCIDLSTHHYLCLWPCAPPCGLARTFHHLLKYFLQGCAISGILFSVMYS